MSVAGAAVLDIHVGRMEQLFNAMDPAPFRERDLDPNAVDYVLEWGRERGADEPLALRVRLDDQIASPEDHAMLRAAVHEYFGKRAQSARRRLKRLFAQGRINLLISLAVLGLMLALGSLLGGMASKAWRGDLIEQSLVIIGWVALWRPAETFLYDWWPIRDEARLYERLSRMHVEVSGSAAEA